MKNNKVLRWIPRILMLVIVTLLFVYPFWWMLVNSLNTNAQVFGQPRLLPQGWKFENYVEIFQKQPFALHYFNTILVAVIGTLGNVFISALSGYGFSRIHFPGRNALFILLLTALMMPIEVIIIPLFYEMKSFNLTDSLIPLMLIPIFCSQGAISAFMFRQFFVTVPKDLEEAARLDGLNHFGIFRYVCSRFPCPWLRPPAFSRFWPHGTRIWSRLSSRPSITKYTLPLSLNNFNDVYGQPEWHLLLAATTLSVVPVMIGLPDFPGKGDRCDGQFRHEGINDEHSFS